MVSFHAALFTFAVLLVEITWTEIIKISEDLTHGKETMDMVLGSPRTEKWWEVLVYHK